MAPVQELLTTRASCFPTPPPTPLGNSDLVSRTVIGVLGLIKLLQRGVPQTTPLTATRLLQKRCRPTLAQIPECYRPQPARHACAGGCPEVSPGEADLPSERLKAGRRLEGAGGSGRNGGRRTYPSGGEAPDSHGWRRQSRSLLGAREERSARGFGHRPLREDPEENLEEARLAEVKAGTAPPVPDQAAPVPSPTGVGRSGLPELPNYQDLTWWTAHLARSPGPAGAEGQAAVGGAPGRPR